MRKNLRHEYLSLLNLDCVGYCNPPPEIENAEATHTDIADIGDNVLYACLDGFTKVGGDSRLTCALADDKLAVWMGAHIECDIVEEGIFLNFYHFCI